MRNYPPRANTKLQAILNRWGLTRRWLVEKTGIPYASVVAYCTGLIKVPHDRAVLINKAITDHLDEEVGRLE